MIQDSKAVRIPKDFSQWEVEGNPSQEKGKKEETKPRKKMKIIEKKKGKNACLVLDYCRVYLD